MSGSDRPFNIDNRRQQSWARRVLQDGPKHVQVGNLPVTLRIRSRRIRIVSELGNQSDGQVPHAGRQCADVPVPDWHEWWWICWTSCAVDMPVVQAGMADVAGGFTGFGGRGKRAWRDRISHAQAIAQRAYGLSVARLSAIGVFGAPSLGPRSATIITS